MDDNFIQTKNLKEKFNSDPPLIEAEVDHMFIVPRSKFFYILKQRKEGGGGGGLRLTFYF